MRTLVKSKVAELGAFVVIRPVYIAALEILFSLKPKCVYPPPLNPFVMNPDCTVANLLFYFISLLG